MPSSNTFAQSVSPKLSPQPSFCIGDVDEENNEKNHRMSLTPEGAHHKSVSGFLDIVHLASESHKLTLDLSCAEKRLSVGDALRPDEGWLLKKSQSMVRVPPPGVSILGAIDLRDEYGLLPYERLVALREAKDRMPKEIKSKWRKIRDKNPDKIIGFYNLCGEIGAGNFSKVKLGIHHLTRVKVAVKIIEKARIEPRMEKMLQREISNLEGLSHPNIIRLYEVIETPDKLHLISELAPGGDLYSMTKLKEKLSENEAKPLYRQVLSAVSFMVSFGGDSFIFDVTTDMSKECMAYSEINDLMRIHLLKHANGIIHRDLKAENILLFPNNIVKVGDLGFSIKSTKGQMLRTFCGSPPYAAPELYRDASYEGVAVDIWALGVILYFMVAGCFPFHGSSIPILKNAILGGVYKVPDKSSDAFVHILQAILQQQPLRRITLAEIIHHPWLKEPPTENNNRLVPISVQNRFYLENKIIPGIPTEEEARGGTVTFEECKSYRILREIGVTEDDLKVHRELGIRSHVTGIYRILLHKTQTGYKWEGKDFLEGRAPPPTTRKFLTSSKSHENFFGGPQPRRNHGKDVGKRRGGSISNIGESVRSSACSIL